MTRIKYKLNIKRYIESFTDKYKDILTVSEDKLIYVGHNSYYGGK
ncbi:MAG: hypothetical protein RR144_04210 [Clostridia bacterium]